MARYVSLDQPDAWANFSPTNVALHELSALVAFGDSGLAPQAARPFMRRHIPVPECPAVRDLVADMAAHDRRRTLPELHHFSRRLGVPA